MELPRAPPLPATPSLASQCLRGCSRCWKPLNRRMMMRSWKHWIPPKLWIFIHCCFVYDSSLPLPVRQRALHILNSTWFQPVVLAMITMNSILLAIACDPLLERILEVGANPAPLTDPGGWQLWLASAMLRPVNSTCKGLLCSPLGMVDAVFLAFYTVEMCIKLIALGALGHKHAYLRSPWNILDGFVVVISWTAIAVDRAVSFSPLRLIRILRPLGVVTRFPELRLLVTTLWNALPKCVYALILLSASALVFAMAGLHTFYGAMRHSCFQLAADNVTWESTGYICNPQCAHDSAMRTFSLPCTSLGAGTLGQGFSAAQGYTCRGAREYLAAERCLCGRSGLESPTCTASDNPQAVLNFDSLSWSGVAFIHVLSLEG